MVEVKDLTKRYGDKVAVDNISFTVKDGEILGFLGPNGAGKTTTMNIITGYTSSTQGTVTVNDAEILHNPIAVKKQIGYLPEHPPLYQDMTVDAYLSFMYDLKKVKRDVLPKREHIDSICALVKIRDVQKRIIKNLSKGYQQRVGLAQALLGNPHLLILDEPTVGLDPKQIIEIRNLIKTLGKKHTIILSSHILSEVQATCERVIVINKGKIIADDIPENLSKAMSDNMDLTLRVDGPQDDVYKLLSGMPEVARVDKVGLREGKVYEYVIHAKEGADVRRKVFGLMAERGWPILAMRSGEMTLEDIFLRLTADADRADGGPGKKQRGLRKKADKAKEADAPAAEEVEVFIEESVVEAEPEPAQPETDGTETEGGDEA